MPQVGVTTVVDAHNVLKVRNSIYCSQINPSEALAEYEIIARSKRKIFRVTVA